MNHAKIILKGAVGINKLLAAVKEVNQKSFDNFFEISQDGNQIVIVEPVPVGGVPRIGISMWYSTKRTIDIRKYMSGDTNWWIQSAFQEGVAQILNARCGDEGISEKWNPEPEKAKTLRGYWKLLNDWEDDGSEWSKRREQHLEATIRRLPEGLKKFAR